MREQVHLSAALLAGLVPAAPACAEQVLVQSETARLAVEPYAAAAKLGSRAELGARVGSLDAALTAAVERGGGRLSLGDTPWTLVNVPAAWTSDDVRLRARWGLGGAARFSLEAGARERRTHNFPNPLGSQTDEQLATDQSRFFRLRAEAEGERLKLQWGAEATRDALDSRTVGEVAAGARRWLAARRLFASLGWRVSERVSVEAAQSAQTLAVGWRGATAASSEAGYLTPSLALALRPWKRSSLRLEAEETLSPVDPAQFAAYAQLATPGAGTAPQPDRGWRYGLSLEQQLPAGARLSARLDDWRFASVTELGPVGPGEAPVSVGSGMRQELGLKVTAPLSPVGLPRATLSGDLSWRRSELADPFTRETRAFSGESPFRAELRLSGAGPTPDLSWSVTAKADGRQSLYQMSQVTELGASSGLGGAVTYGAGPLKLSLELENLVGGGRQVTTYTYAGSRAGGVVSDVHRREDDARAVRISLSRPL